MPNIQVKQLSHGEVDIYPLTVAQAVKTKDGSNVEAVLKAMGGNLFIPCTVDFDGVIKADGKYRKLVGAINSDGSYVVALDQSTYIFDSITNTWILES